MTQITDSMELSVYSDIYKSAHGFRPSLKNVTQEDFDRAVADSQETAAREKAEKQEAVVKFEDTVAEIMESGAGDYETAVRWLREAEEDEYALRDIEYFEWSQGLPYGYFKPLEIN